VAVAFEGEDVGGEETVVARLGAQLGDEPLQDEFVVRTMILWSLNLTRIQACSCNGLLISGIYTVNLRKCSRRMTQWLEEILTTL
jgi:hypothetical protein